MHQSCLWLSIFVSCCSLPIPAHPSARWPSCFSHFLLRSVWCVFVSFLWILFLLTFVFLYIFILPSWITCCLCGHWMAAGWVPPCSRWSIKPLFSFRTRRRVPQQAAVTRARASPHPQPQRCVHPPQHKRFRRAINVCRFPCALAFYAVLPVCPCHAWPFILRPRLEGFFY